MFERYAIIVVFTILVLSFCPIGAVLADGNPTAPIITVSGCTLTVEFDADNTAPYDVQIWDDGSIIQSQVVTGAVGQTFVVQFQFVDIGSEAPGIRVEIHQDGELFFLEVPGITACEEVGCAPALTADAVVGTITSTTEAFWAPSPDAGTPTILEFGDSWWVQGIDKSGSWYQVLISCELVWVPVNAIGPTFDATWNGQPLPTSVIDWK